MKVLICLALRAGRKSILIQRLLLWFFLFDLLPGVCKEKLDINLSAIFIKANVAATTNKGHFSAPSFKYDGWRSR